MTVSRDDSINVEPKLHPLTRTATSDHSDHSDQRTGVVGCANRVLPVENRNLNSKLAFIINLFTDIKEDARDRLSATQVSK